MTTDLTGKIALVTGSARGIGHVIATTLAARGAHVLAHQRVAGDSPLVAAIVASGGKATVVTGDLETPAGVAALATSTIAALDGARLDILVHNAGILAGGTYEEETVELFDKQFAVNVRAPLFLTRALLPHLADDGGRIIVLSSVVARTAFPGYLSYAMTKGAVNVFIRNLAAELGPRGITVNGIAPGVIETDMSSIFAGSDEGRAFVLSMQALKRIGQPDDIADVVAFYASAASRWITGQIVEVSGGSKL